MIKECKILSYNKFLNIVVFDYDGLLIQASTIIDSNCKTVFVEYKDKKYRIVDKNEYDKYVRESKKKETFVKSNKEKLSKNVPE